MNPDHNGFYDQIVKALFQRVGLQAKAILLPSERSLINANAGIDDGNIARVRGIEKKYQNLVMVPEKVVEFHFVIYTKDRQLKITEWNDLQKYNIAFINGWKFLEKNVKYYKSLLRARDADQLFALLENDRVDLVLYDQWRFKNNTGEIKYLSPSMANKSLYLYLNKKYKHLAYKLASELRLMKQDGSYQKIYNQTLGSLN